MKYKPTTYALFAAIMFSFSLMNLLKGHYILAGMCALCTVYWAYGALHSKRR